MNHLPTLSSLLSNGWATFKKNWKFIIPAGIATVVILAVLRMLQDTVSVHMSVRAIFILVSFVAGIIITLGWTRVLLTMVRTGHASWDDFKTRFRSWGHYLIAKWTYSFFVGLGVMVTFIPLLSVIIGKFTGIFAVLSIIVAILGVIYTIWFLVRYVFLSYIIVDHPSNKSLFQPFVVAIVSILASIGLARLSPFLLIIPAIVLIGYMIMYSRGFFLKSAELVKGHMWKILGYVIVFGLINLLGLICIVVGLFVTVPLTKLAMTKLYESLKQKSA